MLDCGISDQILNAVRMSWCSLDNNNTNGIN